MAHVRTACAAALLLGVAACSSDYDDGGDTLEPAIDMTGTWSFLASTAKPPQAIACTGALSGFSGELLCGSLGIEINQVEASFTGNSTAAFCNQQYTVTGSVSGSAISGVLTSTEGPTTRQVSFDGQASGDSATLDVQRLTIAGSPDFCTLSGTYNAVR